MLLVVDAESTCNLRIQEMKQTSHFRGYFTAGQTRAGKMLVPWGRDLGTF